MYKTVRQGENSLQYTILPQTEELLTNSGMKGKGRDYSPSCHARRITKKLMLYYMAVMFFALLLMVGTLLFGLVLCGVVPIDLPSRVSSLTHDHSVKTSSICSTSQPDKVLTKKRIENVNLSPEITTGRNYNLMKDDDDNENHLIARAEGLVITTVFNPSIPTTVLTTEPEWKLPALKRLEVSTTSPSIYPTSTVHEATTANIEKPTLPYVHQRESNADLMSGHDQINSWTDFEEDDDDDEDEDYDLTKPPIAEVISQKQISSTPKYLGAVTETVPSPSTLATNRKNDIAIKTNKSEKNKSKMDAVKYSETKGHISNDEEGEYKEPLTDEEDISEQSLGDDVKMSQAKSSWLQTRWPFVDPSSYFQWTGYSARDNLLLPAILSAALSALLVLAVLCYALRRRQRCKRRTQEIGNLTSDLQAEDNAILLTAENPSEED